MATKRSSRSGRSQAHEPAHERKIYFYDLDCGQRDGKRIDFDPVPSLQHIAELPFTKDGRYLDVGEGNVVFAEPVSFQYPQKVTFVLSRRTDLPELERRGHMKPLPIPADSGLGEKIHVMFFGRYAAADINYRGPRPTMLASYLALKAKNVGTKLRMEQLLRGEATKDLRKLDGLTVARFKLRESAVHLIESADESLHAAFRSLLASSDADQLELVLRRERPRGSMTRYLAEHILDGVRRLASRRTTYEEFSKLEVKGVNKDTARVESIDVLEDQLILTRRMVKVDPRSRAVSSESAFEQIEDAFREVLPRLGEAGTLS